MNYGCPKIECENFQKTFTIIKNGRFKRKSDSRYVQKYKCTACRKQFSRATFTLEKYQKKRRINLQVLEGLSSGISMRRIAKNLRVDKKTIKRKMDYLAIKCHTKNIRFLKKLNDNKVSHLQVDDLITTEHTKLKPLSLSVAVDADRRYILGVEVSAIPAFGHIAQMSRDKYGYRKSQHKNGLDRLMSRISEAVDPYAIIRTDEHKLYPEFTRRYFPEADHERYKGGKGCVVGQGELKKLYRDPLFAINHTCAMLRANINRLARKTWCTTKDPAMLKKHLDIFMYYYNNLYLRDVKT